MSRTYRSKSKTEHKTPYFSYLARSDEPDEIWENDDLDAVQLANRFLLRQRVRHNIKRLRHHYES